MAEQDFLVWPFQLRGALFSLGCFGFETFRPHYGILQKSYILTFFNAKVLTSTKGFI